MPEALIVISVFLFMGGTVKGVTGAGTPVVAVPALAAFYGVEFAVVIMIMPNLVNNLWQAWSNRHTRSNVPFLRTFVIAGAAGTLIGTWLLVELPKETLSICLGVIVCFYILLRLTRPHWQLSLERASKLAPFAGMMSGILQGGTGISAPVSVTFLNALRLERQTFIFAISSLFLCYMVTQIPALIASGLMSLERFQLSLLAVLPTLLGLMVGGKLAARVSPAFFDRIILVFLVAMTIKLFWDAATG